MLFHTTDAHGITHLKPSPAEMRRMLQQAASDPETRGEDIALINDENGWSLGWTPQGGVAVWENLDDPDQETRFQQGVSLEHVWRLWQDLAQGRVALIQAEPWSQSLNT